MWLLASSPRRSCSLGTLVEKEAWKNSKSMQKSWHVALFLLHHIDTVVQMRGLSATNFRRWSELLQSLPSLRLCARLVKNVKLLSWTVLPAFEAEAYLTKTVPEKMRKISAKQICQNFEHWLHWLRCRIQIQLTWNLFLITFELPRNEPLAGSTWSSTWETWILQASTSTHFHSIHSPSPASIVIARLCCSSPLA